MFEFWVVAFIVFFFLGRSYTISKKKGENSGVDGHSFFIFTAFMCICTALWLAFKYAYKSTFLIFVCLLFWKDIRKFFDGLDVEKKSDTNSIPPHG